jgi:hypothetical protein
MHHSFTRARLSGSLRPLRPAPLMLASPTRPVAPRRPAASVGDKEIDSILLHLWQDNKFIYRAHSVLQSGFVSCSYNAVKFLDLAYTSDLYTLMQGCKGEAGVSDGCARTPWFEEGANARS